MSIITWFNEHLTFYRAGFGVTLLGFLQFMVFMGLDKIGLIDIGSGLGPGLLMWAIWVLGGTLVGAGILVDVVDWIRKRNK